MAVAVDATSTAVVTPTGITSYTGTANITVGSSLSNGALVLLVQWTAASLPTGISVHWDSAGTNQLMTSIGAGTNSTSIARTELFGLINPTAGNKTVNITWSTGGASDLEIYGVSWTGVDQTGGATSFAHPTSANNQSPGAAGVVTLNITSATGNAVMAGYTNDFAWASPTPCNQTQLYLSNGATNAGCANRAAGAASVSMTATNGGTADNACAFGCDIVAASGAAAAPFYKQWDRPGFDLPGITPQHYVRNPSQFPNPIPFQDQQQRHTRQVPLVGPPQSLPLNINLFTNPIPFSQTDWSPQKPFYRVSQQTQPYNNVVYVAPVVTVPFSNTWLTPTLQGPSWPQAQLNTLINLLAQPFYTQDFATSHTIPDWAPPTQYTNLVLQNFSTPFYTQDFSKPFVSTPAKQDQQALNVNIFTNPVPFNQYDWSTTKQRTIPPDVNLLNIVLLNPPIVSIPFSQLTWPKTSGVPSAPSDFYNMVLYTIATDAPFAQYDWSHGEFLPSVSSSPIVLNTNLFTNPIPFNQLDWSKYYRTVTLGLDSLPNIVLLNPTSSPFFYQDFSRPFVPTRPVISAQSVNTNLFTNPVPLNQIDWSKPYRIVPIASDQNSLPNIILYQPVPSNPSNPLGIYSWMDLYKYVTLYPTTPALLQNLTLILPPPPPDTGPVGGWRWIDGVMRMREKQLDRRDQNASAVMLGKLGGLARAQALTTRQRSNIASKAAQVRWNPPAKKR